MKTHKKYLKTIVVGLKCNYVILKYENEKKLNLNNDGFTFFFFVKY